MREFKTGKGEFIATCHGDYFSNKYCEIIGTVSQIKESEELSKKILDEGESGGLTYYPDYEFMEGVTDAKYSFQSLASKHQLKESDLIIKKLCD